MKCDNAKCGKKIEERDAYLAVRQVPAYGSSRVMQRLWETHRTFCSRTCLLAFINSGGEI